jgi:3-methyladenine DNA glycosylase AlkD
MPDPPKALVARALAELRRRGDPERARGAAAYFKAYERLRFFGVRAPEVRRLAAEIRKGAAGWRAREAIAFAEIMIARPELEAKAIGMLVLAKHPGAMTPSLLPRARRWLARYCTDWASTDLLCGEVIGRLLEREPALVPRLEPWRRSRDLYVRRASAVALIPLARQGRALDDAYAAARALGGEAHHLLQKAAGWLLREAGKTDMARLERFLRRHGAALSRTTINYAIERFGPRARAALLSETRARATRTGVL